MHETQECSFMLVKCQFQSVGCVGEVKLYYIDTLLYFYTLLRKIKIHFNWSFISALTCFT